MSTLPTLVRELAKVDGRPLKTIDHVARLVREAGFMPTGRPGRGAAQMDETAAANLIIGLNGCDAPRNAVKVIPIYRSLKSTGVARGDALFGFLNDIEAAEGFGEGLDIAIGAVPCLLRTVNEYILDAWKLEPGTEQAQILMRQFCIGEGPAGFEVRLSRYFAEMALMVTDASGAAETVWQARFYNMSENIKQPADETGIGRSVAVTLRFPMLLAASNAIRGFAGSYYSEALQDLFELTDVN